MLGICWLVCFGLTKDGEVMVVGGKCSLHEGFFGVTLVNGCIGAWMQLEHSSEHRSRQDVGAFAAAAPLRSHDCAAWLASAAPMLTLAALCSGSAFLGCVQTHGGFDCSQRGKAVQRCEAGSTQWYALLGMTV